MYVDHASPSMRPVLDAAKGLAVRLDAGLAEYLSRGLIEIDGVILAARREQRNTEPRSRFADRTAYEGFVNKIRFSGWASETLEAAPLHVQVAHALVLADAVAKAAIPFGQKIVIILSIDIEGSDVVFRFHVSRPDEPPWTTDVLEATEPILVRIYAEPGNQADNVDKT